MFSLLAARHFPDAKLARPDSTMNTGYYIYIYNICIHIYTCLQVLNIQFRFYNKLYIIENLCQPSFAGFPLFQIFPAKMDWTVGIGLALTAVAFLALTGLDAAVEGVESTACTSHLEQAVLMRALIVFVVAMDQKWNTSFVYVILIFESSIFGCQSFWSDAPTHRKLKVWLFWIRFEEM